MTIGTVGACEVGSFQTKPFPTVEIFRNGIQVSLGSADVFLAAQVCKSWNLFVQQQDIYFELFLKYKIPFVECINDQGRNYKEDFKILYPITLNGRMIEQLFGKIDGPIPELSAAVFSKLCEDDPFKTRRNLGGPAYSCFKDLPEENLKEPKKIAKTFKVVVMPNAFVRPSTPDFPFILNQEGDLVELEDVPPTGEMLTIPNGIRNLMVLCKYPLTNKGDYLDKFIKPPIFETVKPEILEQCNIVSKETSLYLMRKNIPYKTTTRPYLTGLVEKQRLGGQLEQQSQWVEKLGQKEFIEQKGFEVTPLRVRAFSNAISMLETDACPDDFNKHRHRYVCTSDTVSVGANFEQAIIGNFIPSYCGLTISSCSPNERDAELAAIPGLPAQASKN